MTGASRQLLGIALLSAALALPAAQQDRKRTEQDLRAVTERLERVQRQVAQDAVEKDRMKSRPAAGRTFGIERAWFVARVAQPAQPSGPRGASSWWSSALPLRRSESKILGDLARQLRSAYFMGRNEPLKLLLNQRNSSEISRNLTY